MFTAALVAKIFRDLSPSVLTFIGTKSLQLSFTLNCVLKGANDFTTPVRLSPCSGVEVGDGSKSGSGRVGVTVSFHIIISLCFLFDIFFCFFSFFNSYFDFWRFV